MRIKTFLITKPKFWIVLFSVIIVAAVGIGLATNHGLRHQLTDSLIGLEIIYKQVVFFYLYHGYCAAVQHLI